MAGIKNTLLFREVISALEQDELYQGLHKLKVLIDLNSNFDLNEDWMQINQSYGTLLSYMSQGIADEQREIFHHQFIRNCYSLSFRAIRASQLKNDTSLYYSFLRKAEHENLSIESLIKKLNDNKQQEFFSSVTGDNSQTVKLQNEHESLMNDLFLFVWTSEEWSENEVQLIDSLFREKEFPDEDKLLLISAITLSLFVFLDARKLQFIINLYQSGTVKTRIRTFFGLIFTLVFHQRILHHFPLLMSEILSIQQNPHFVKDLTELQIQLISLSKMEEIQHKINEEIIPNFINSNAVDSQNIVDINKVEEILEDDKEFESPFDKETTNKLRDSVSELIKMQEQGADVYYVSFKNLKHFPFFRTLANWFRPFNFNNAEFLSLNNPESSSLRSMIIDSDMCDSDKYSLGLMFQTLPGANLQMIKEQIGGKQNLNISDTSAAKSKNPMGENLLKRFFLQDCYRFYMLFEGKNEFKNPFEENMLLTECPLFNKVFSQSKEELLKIGYFAYQQNDLQKCIKVFSHFSSKETLPLEALQMYGHSLQKMKDYEAAITCYIKATILSPSSIWTLRQLAYCYRMIGNLKEAVNNYNRIIVLEPSDTSALLHLGECFFHSGDVESAMKQFYKVEYLHPDSISAMRAIAWYSLSSDNPQQAEKYYQKIFSIGPKRDDFFNAGHTAWVNGQITTAIERYQKYLSGEVKQHELFSFPSSDVELLTHYGIQRSDIHFMTDILNQKYFS